MKSMCLTFEFVEEKERWDSFFLQYGVHTRKQQAQSLSLRYSYKKAAAQSLSLRYSLSSLPSRGLGGGITRTAAAGEAGGAVDGAGAGGAAAGGAEGEDAVLPSSPVRS